MDRFFNRQGSPRKVVLAIRLISFGASPTDSLLAPHDGSRLSRSTLQRATMASKNDVAVAWAWISLLNRLPSMAALPEPPRSWAEDRGDLEPDDTETADGCDIADPTRTRTSN